MELADEENKSSGFGEGSMSCNTCNFLVNTDIQVERF